MSDEQHSPADSSSAPPDEIARLPLVEWDLVDAFTLVCLDAGIIGVASLVAPLAGPPYSRLVAAAVRLVLLLPSLLYVTKRMWGIAPIELGIIRPVRGSLRFILRFSAALAIGYALLGVAAVAAGYHWRPDLFADLPRLARMQSQASTTFLRGTAGTVSFAFLGLVSAPICEEIVFRGVLYPALRSSLGRAWSVVLSAFVFAGIHLVWHGKLFVPLTQFLGGLIFAWTYEKTRSLLYPIIFHAIGNAAILVWHLAFAHGGDWIASML